MYFNFLQLPVIFLLHYFLFFSFSKLLLKSFLRFFSNKPILLVVGDLQVATNKREDNKGKFYLGKVNIRVRGRKREQLYSYFFAISFLFLIVLPSSEHYPRLQKRNTAFLCFLRQGQYNEETSHPIHLAAQLKAKS